MRTTRPDDVQFGVALATVSTSSRSKERARPSTQHPEAFVKLILRRRTLLGSVLRAALFVLALAPAFARANPLQWMTDLINDSRYAIGQQQLHYDDRLMAAAFHHAKDMAERNYFSHHTPEGWSVWTRATGWGWPGWAPVGETLVCGSEDASWMFQLWMGSDAHRAILHNGSYNRMGVAHYYAPYSSCQHYWVVVVGQL